MNWKQLLLVSALVVSVHGHGYLKDPPMRGSMWRSPRKYPFMKKFINENDDSLDAGGPGVVREDFPKKKFGMCGDVHTDKAPRAHETGGEFGRFEKLGKNAIAACYEPGSAVSFKVEVTIGHGGFSQFQLCVPNPGENESEKCFENGFLLERKDGSGSKTDMPIFSNTVVAKYKLPQNVTCEGNNRCVLRWYWFASNADTKSSIVSQPLFYIFISLPLWANLNNETLFHSSPYHQTRNYWLETINTFICFLSLTKLNITRAGVLELCRCANQQYMWQQSTAIS